MEAHINQRLDWKANGQLSALPMIDADLHRSGMRHFASGVSIITTRDGETPVGLTATAVCSVTVDPPRMVVLINKKVAAADAILASGALCINQLTTDQEGLARVFAGMVEGVYGPARFEHGSWSQLVTGAPALEGALATLDCRVIKVFDESTHHAFLCEVLAASEPPGGEPLLYVNGAFHRIIPLES
ncbi:MAG: flavin reductase family protein [Xanthobacter sp.]